MYEPPDCPVILHLAIKIATILHWDGPRIGRTTDLDTLSVHDG